MSEEERIGILKSLGLLEPLRTITKSTDELLKLLSGDMADFGMLVEGVIKAKESGTI